MLMRLTLDRQGFPVLDGRVLDLAPKERAVLALLVRERPRVVSKEAFARAAWGGVMSDESLARCISRVRRAVPGVQVEAVYGQGYRLVDEGPAAHTRLLAAAQAPPVAVETHLHARALSARRAPWAMQRALALLRVLVHEHPGYASAQLSLAEALAAAASWGLRPGPGAVREGLAALEAARRADPDLPGLDVCEGWLLDLGWRFDEAEVAFERACAGVLDAPSQMLCGWHRLVLGEPQAAAAHFEQALAQQPHDPLLQTMRARAWVHQGRPDLAQRALDRTCAEHPDCLIAAAYRAGVGAWVAPAGTWGQEAWRVASLPDAPPFAVSVLGYALARGGRRDEALDLVHHALRCALATPCSNVLHAATLTELGRLDEAARLLRAACDAHCALLPMVLRDPANAVLWAHPAVRPVCQAVFGSRSWAGAFVSHPATGGTTA